MVHQRLPLIVGKVADPNRQTVLDEKHGQDTLGIPDEVSRWQDPGCRVGKGLMRARGGVLRFLACSLPRLPLPLHVARLPRVLRTHTLHSNTMTVSDSERLKASHYSDNATIWLQNIMSTFLADQRP
jgi:hypothetical protein